MESAVDSLLSRLSSVLVDEARLLGKVRGDMEFIEEEMESMKGFLLDVTGGGRSNNQVQAWTKQVRRVAYDSQNWIDRYMQTLGSSRPSAGLLASLRRVPRLVRTVPERHRIATRIQELKARAREVGERRQRYGVAVPVSLAESSVTRGDSTTKLKEEEEAARKRRVLDAATALLDIHASARKVMAWLIRRGSDRRQRTNSFAELVKELSPPKIVKLAQEAIRDDEAIAAMRDAFHKTAEAERGVMNSWFGKIVESWTGLSDHIGKPTAHSPQEDHGKGEKSAAVHAPSGSHQGEHYGKGKKPTAVASMAEKVAATTSPIEIFFAEVSFGWNLIRWLQKTFGDDHQRGLVLAIVTPPVDVNDPEDDDLHADMPATELARTVYNQSREEGRFQCMAWIDARRHSERWQRLQSLLQEVWQGPHEDTSTWGEKRLEQEIKKHLKGKSFLIVLADHEDDSPWSNIISALPTDYSDHSAIIVTPLIQEATQFLGWCIASWLFVHSKFYRFKVHFYPHHEAVSNKANKLLVLGHHSQDSLQAIVRQILKKCRWDPFSTNMFLHALHANSHRSEEELERLLLDLKDFSTVSNARHIIRFCYDDLPSQYKTCLQYLSIFPQGSEIRKTSLVRRWTAENLISRRHALVEAERVFSALFDRGLVLPNKIGHAGKVKTYMVHSHVFSFITKMAREDNVGNKDLTPNLACRFSIRNEIQLQQLSKKQLATHSNSCWRFHKSPPPTNLGDSEDPWADMVTFLNLLPASSQLGLIKVLDLEGCNGLNKHNLKNICNKIFQLKYLSLRNTDVTKLPKEIGKLQDLETFDIRQTKIKSFPAKASVLPKLVHLLAGHTDRPSNDTIGSNESFSTVHMPREIGTMTNMQILSHVEVSQEVNEQELENVGSLQQLRKLGVVIHGSEAHLLTIFLQVIGKLDECLRSLSVHIKPIEDEANSPDVNMDTMEIKISPPKSLESLNINGKITVLPTWIKELHQLSKITLCRTSLMDIQFLGKLVNLRCIRLRYKSYTGTMLSFKEKEFKKLEFLLVEGTEISDILFGHNGAPKLEKIVWTPTSKANLQGIDKLPSLKKIELTGNCDTHHIKEDMEANPNYPTFTHKRVPEATTAAAAATAGASGISGPP